MLRAIARQHRRMLDAIVPLLSLGSECDMDALWCVVASLDSRLTALPFSGDNSDDVRRLEASLDEVSVWIIDLLHQGIQERYGAISLSHGLVDGHWVIYAVVPRGARLAAPTLPGQVSVVRQPAPEPRQASLWEM